MISEQSGEVPSDWKKGNIFKKGRKEDTGNCCPISLTSVPAKVMEQILSESVLRYMEDREVIPDSQHSFVKVLPDPSSALLGLSDYISGQGKGYGCLCSCKAFYTVPQNILLSKLKSCAWIVQ